MADLNEIDNCVSIFKNDSNKICLLKCTSDYPSTIKTTHLGQMVSLKKRFNVSVGLSDHSMSNLPAVVSTSLGATVIEKHFIIEKTLKTPDAFFSLDENEFKSLVDDIRATSSMMKLTDLEIIRQDSESHSLWERPSLYFSDNYSTGHVIKKDNLMIRRPSLGLHPSKIDQLIGKKLKISVKKYQPLDINFFE